MISLELTNIAFYQELLARGDKQSVYLAGILVGTERDAQAGLEYVKHLFPSYTNHGIQHSWRILQCLSNVIKKDAMSKMSSIEIFCLIFIAMFHDMGMVQKSTADAELVRREHHVFSKEAIIKYFEHINFPAGYSERMLEYICFSVEAHGLTWEEMVQNDQFGKRDKIVQDIVRPALLAILIRVGDLLDFDTERTNDFLLEAYPEFFYGDSLIHHEHHKHVKQNFQDVDEICIVVEAHTKEEHLMWKNWFGYLENDILKANTYIFLGGLEDFRFPPLKYLINKHKDAKYELVDLKFDIDEKGRIWDVVSNYVYTGHFDFIRELIQNAIDAELINIYNSAAAQVPHASPRSWKLVGYEPLVVVAFSQNKQRLVIADSGIGMDKDDLQNFLFKVADTGYHSQTDSRKFGFPAIAKFGIGFISTLTRASEITVDTKKYAHTNGDGLRVSLHSNSNQAYVEQLEKSEAGTKISLNLKYEYTSEEIAKYLRDNFLYCSIPIAFVNLDVIEKVSIEARKINITMPDVTSLLSGKSELFRNEISRICKEVNKTIDNKVFLSDIYNDIGTPFQVLPSKAVLMKFDSNLSIEEICFDVTSDTIKKNTSGVLWIPVEYMDYEEGIEWVSFHAFLFTQRNVTKTLVSFDLSPIDEKEYEEPVFIGTNHIDDWADDWANESPDDYEKFVYLSKNQDPEKVNYSEFYIPVKYLELKDNSIFRYWDVEMDSDTGKIEKNEFSGGVDLLDGEFILLKKYDSREKDDLSVKYIDLVDRCLLPLDNTVCQDGIKIDLSADNICALGACRARLNLTGSARIDLNITRNSIDENPKKMEEWANRIASKIQAKVINNINTAFKDLGIYCNVRNFITYDKKSKQHLRSYTTNVLKQRLDSDSH
jgi:hypothetical protein